jgi:hypothetical protein
MNLHAKGAHQPRRRDADIAEAENAAHAIDADRYPLSRRIRTLRGILGKIRPEPPREALPPLKHYEPPKGGTRYLAFCHTTS